MAAGAHSPGGDGRRRRPSWAFATGRGLSNNLGDTDDAMRLVLVRGLLKGRGWWDQHLMRLQPPMGLYMHWSRLLDGGIAGLEHVFALFVDWPRAEWLTRLIWPVLWIFPAISAMLLLTDRLSERPEGAGGITKVPGAVMIAAPLLPGGLHPLSAIPPRPRGSPRRADDLLLSRAGGRGAAGAESERSDPSRRRHWLRLGDRA